MVENWREKEISVSITPSSGQGQEEHCHKNREEDQPGPAINHQSALVETSLGQARGVRLRSGRHRAAHQCELVAGVYGATTQQSHRRHLQHAVHGQDAGRRFAEACSPKVCSTGISAVGTRQTSPTCRLCSIPADVRGSYRSLWATPACLEVRLNISAWAKGTMRWRRREMRFTGSPGLGANRGR